MILGSGNVVHNLRRVEWDKPDRGVRLGASASTMRWSQQLADDPATSSRSRNIPTTSSPCLRPTISFPCSISPGLRPRRERPIEPLLRGYAMGSLSMTCYGVGADLGCREEEDAAAIPDGVPADQTNI